MEAVEDVEKLFDFSAPFNGKHLSLKLETFPTHIMMWVDREKRLISHVKFNSAALNVTISTLKIEFTLVL